MSSMTARFEDLLEPVPEALVGMDDEGVIWFVNAQTESLFGNDRDRLVGQPIQSLVLGPLWQVYADHRRDDFADTRISSSGLDLELRGRRGDGIEFPINVNLSRIDMLHALLVITAVHDVAQQRKAVYDAQLMAAIVDSSDDAIIATTTEGIITSWNPAAERMFGYPSKEILGRSGGILTPGDRAGEMNAILARVKAGRPVGRCETVRVRKDGTDVPVSLTIAPIRDADDEVVGTSVICRDVTEERKAWTVAERMTSIVESSDDAIIGKTLDGVITSWNPAAERLYGYSSAEIVGKPIFLITPQDRTGEVKAILTKIRLGQRVEHFETVRVRKDQTLVWVSLTISPIRDADGAIVGASTIARDITEQKKALAVAERMASMVESSDDAIISKTLEGIITSWNPAAERLYGYSSEEIVGKPIYLIIPSGRTGEITAILTKIRSGQRVEHLETVRVRKDKTLVPVSLTISPIRDPEGMIVGASTIARDMTGQRQALAAAQQIAAIVESSNDAIIGGTPNGTIVSWNPAAEALFGYTSAEIIGKPLSQLGTKDRAGTIRAVLGRVRAAQRVEHFETVAIRKDKTLVSISLTVSPVRDPEGAVVGTSVICREITGLHHRAQSSVETRLDPLVTLSPDGKIHDLNAAAVELTGVPRDELIGSDFSHLFTDPGKAREGYLLAFSRGLVTDYPLTLRHPDGTVTDVWYRASVYAETSLLPAR